MKRLEDKSKSLAHAISVYTTDAKKFAEQINNVSSNIQLSMDIQAKNTAKYDGLLDVAYGMVTQVATFFGGPLGYAIATSVKKSWDAYNIDGSFLSKMTNTILAGATSSLTSRILLDTVSTETKTNLFLYSSKPLYQSRSNNDSGLKNRNNYNPDNKLYTARYTAMNCMTEFFNAMVRSGVPDATQAKTAEQKIDFIEKNQEKYAEYAINKAILYIVISTFQLHEVMTDKRVGSPKDKYRNLYYKSFSDLMEGIQIKSSHAGSDHRQVLKRFFGDQDEYGLNLDHNRERGVGVRNDLMKRTLQARRQFGWEWLAKDTDYNRKFIKLAVDPSGKYDLHRKEWYELNVWAGVQGVDSIKSAGIAKTHLHTNDKYKIAIFKSHENEIEINIGRKDYYMLIDIKCCLWAYIDDYNSYFKSKLKSNFKLDLGKFMPSLDDLSDVKGADQNVVRDIQQYWTNSYYIAKNSAISHRTQDLAIIYLLMKIPEIVLGVPIQSYVIEGEAEEFIDESIAKLVCALYLGVSSAIYFHLEERSKRTNSGFGRNRVTNDTVREAGVYVKMFVLKLSDILFSPFYRFKLKADVSQNNLSKAEALGFSNNQINNNHNRHISKNMFMLYVDKMGSNLSDFTKATTPIDKNINPQLLNGINNPHCVHTIIRDMTNKCLDDYLDKNDGFNAYEVVSNDYILKYPDFTENLSLGTSNLDGEYDFNAIANHYSKLGAAAVIGGVGSLSAVGVMNYGDNGKNYLPVSTVALENNIGADKDDNVSNKTARYAAIRKSFVKQRLSMQALQAKKVSPEEVFENMEETLMLLTAEVFQGENIKVKDNLERERLERERLERERLERERLERLRQKNILIRQQRDHDAMLVQNALRRKGFQQEVVGRDRSKNFSDI